MEQTCLDSQEHTLFIILFPTLNHVPKNYFLLHVGAYLVPADQGSSVFVQSCYTTDLGYVVITLYCSSHFFKILDSWLFFLSEACTKSCTEGCKFMFEAGVLLGDR